MFKTEQAYPLMWYPLLNNFIRKTIYFFTKIFSKIWKIRILKLELKKKSHRNELMIGHNDMQEMEEKKWDRTI